MSMHGHAKAVGQWVGGSPDSLYGGLQGSICSSGKHIIGQIIYMTAQLKCSNAIKLRFTHPRCETKAYFSARPALWKTISCAPSVLYRRLW